MPYRWLKYDEVIRRSEALARGLLTKGLEVGQETFVGIYSRNRPEVSDETLSFICHLFTFYFQWIITEQACYVYNMILVPLYDTLGPEASAFILKQSKLLSTESFCFSQNSNILAEMKLVVVEQSAKAEALLLKHAECPTLKMVVVIEKAEPTLLKQAETAGVEIVQFDVLIQEGEKLADSSPAPTPPTPEDLCVISYTSGTTGNPKGVMLTHGNVAADTASVVPFKYAIPDGNDTYFSFLPLAHMFERVLNSAVYALGGRVGFYRGDIKLLLDDAKELKPTLMAVVPRVLNRVYDKVWSTASQSFVKKLVLSVAVMAKKWQLDR